MWSWCGHGQVRTHRQIYREHILYRTTVPDIDRSIENTFYIEHQYLTLTWSAPRAPCRIISYCKFSKVSALVYCGNKVKHRDFLRLFFLPLRWPRPSQKSRFPVFLVFSKKKSQNLKNFWGFVAASLSLSSARSCLPTHTHPTTHTHTHTRTHAHTLLRWAYRAQDRACLAARK